MVEITAQMISHPKKLPLFCQDKEQRGGIGKNSMRAWSATPCLHTVQRHASIAQNSLSFQAESGKDRA
jgi:hypothetical protein